MPEFSIESIDFGSPWALLVIAVAAIIQDDLTCLVVGSAVAAGEVEPLPAEAPLWDAPNIILTPHRAGASHHRPRKVYEFFAAQLERYVKGKQVLNIVNKRKGY